MLSPRFAASFLVLAATVLSAAGCGQRENEVCQVDSDCAAGLTCECQIGGGRGICLPSGSTTSCASSGTDGGTRDGGVDSGVDAAPFDAAPFDAGSDGGSDAGSDAGTQDAGADTGVDRG